MREIKFRAWNKRIGWKEKDGSDCVPKMEYRGFIIYPETGLSEFPQGGWDIGGYTEKEDSFVLMQYTGLKDKNGKEIYEGDLVWHGRLELEHPLQVGIGGYWPTEGDCGWGVHVYNQDETFVEGVSAFNQDNDLEVVGNIYENPELLNK